MPKISNILCVVPIMVWPEEDTNLRKSQGAPLSLTPHLTFLMSLACLLFFNGILNVFVLVILKVALFIPQTVIWSILLSYSWVNLPK